MGQMDSKVSRNISARTNCVNITLMCKLDTYAHAWTSPGVDAPCTQLKRKSMHMHTGIHTHEHSVALKILHTIKCMPGT